MPRDLWVWEVTTSLEVADLTAPPRLSRVGLVFPGQAGEHGRHTKKSGRPYGKKDGVDYSRRARHALRVWFSVFSATDAGSKVYVRYHRPP